MRKYPIFLIIILLFSSIAYAGSYDWVRSPMSLLGLDNNWTGVNVFNDTIYAKNFCYLNGTCIGSGGVTDHSLLTNLEWSKAGHIIDTNLNMNGYNLTNASNVPNWYYNATGNEWIMGYVSDLP